MLCNDSGEASMRALVNGWGVLTIKRLECVDGVLVESVFGGAEMASDAVKMAFCSGDGGGRGFAKGL